MTDVLKVFTLVGLFVLFILGTNYIQEQTGSSPFDVFTNMIPRTMPKLCKSTLEDGQELMGIDAQIAPACANGNYERVEVLQQMTCQKAAEFFVSVSICTETTRGSRTESNLKEIQEYVTQGRDEMKELCSLNVSEWCGIELGR